jgi:tetratricopeptide (TPR) repeat protein
LIEAAILAAILWWVLPRQEWLFEVVKAVVSFVVCRLAIPGVEYGWHWLTAPYYLQRERLRDLEASTSVKPGDQQSIAPFMAPPDLGHFVGREAELGHLSQALAHVRGPVPRLVSVVGIGGIGKSVLAAHFATLHRERFPDGVFWTRVDSETPIDMARNVATALGHSTAPQNDSHARAVLQKLLAGKRALVVLDNADGPTAIERLEYMRPNSDTVAVLITTQNRGLASAVGARQLDLAGFDATQADRLFAKVLGSKPLSELESSEVERIAGLVGGSPLAIDLAAQAIARHEQTSIADFRRWLEQPASALQMRAAGKNIEATVTRSLELLEVDQRACFLTLGACADAGFSLETAKGTVPKDYSSRVDRVLRELCDLSLVQKKPNDRFGLHPIIRAFVRSQPNAANADLAHATYWYHFVDCHSNDRSSDWEKLIGEWEGIRTAWDWCLSATATDVAQSARTDFELVCRTSARLAAGLRFFLDALGLWRDANQRMPGSLRAAQLIGDVPLQFVIRRHFALYLRKSGQLDEAAALNIENIRLAENQGRLEWVAIESEQLGRVRLRQQKLTEAAELFGKALHIARSPDGRGPRDEGQALSCLGELFRREGNLDAAVKNFEEALSIYDELNDRQGVCSTLIHLGDVHLDAGRTEAARQTYMRAIKEFPQSKRAEVEGSIYQGLGLALHALGRDLDALACFVISADVCGWLGIPGWRNQPVAEARDRLVSTLGSKARRLDAESTPVDETVKNARAHVAALA